MLAMRLRGTPRTASASRARRGGRKKTSLMEQFAFKMVGKKALTCVCVVHAISSELTPYSIARTPSASILPALGPKAAQAPAIIQPFKGTPGDPERKGGKMKDAPMMCTLSMQSDSSSTRNLTWPLVSRFVLARKLVRKGNWPTLYCTPSFFRSCSVFPTHATSGGSCCSSRAHAPSGCTQPLRSPLFRLVHKHRPEQVVLVTVTRRARVG